MRIWTRASGRLPMLVAGAAALVAAGACNSDDGLGGGFGRGDDIKPGDDDPGDPPYPIEPGTTFHYRFARSHVEDVSATGPGGDTVNEISVSGHLCVRVESVSDRYATDEPSTLRVGLRVSGAQTQDDVDVSRVDDQGQPVAVTGEEADAATAALWLTRALPARDHGLHEATEATLDTRTAAVPPDFALVDLLFYDPRESRDRLWRGWSDTGGDVPGARSVVGDVVAYLIDTFGYELFSDPARLRHRFNQPGGDCGGLVEADCTDPCAWEDDACRPRPAFLELSWRETLDPGAAGPDLEGPVFHSLRIEYRWDGSLAGVTEYVKPDHLEATEEIPSFQQLHNCTPIPVTQISDPCAEASVRILTSPFATAPCGF